MTENEMKSMTVVQLRKTAKDLGVTLGAGIDKAGIIQKILAHADVLRALSGEKC